ncbi:hypothetical protein NA56DRAFT_703847 [Hyaloscypha hepaticicola]|uniref:Uncharacterized protein n=1 Tax=Hyaloscypha hepaticicola TaxID=2082293 RepID=A0A2J6Q4I4_9HELO|nr:hypothetical protein NA56DRAFT_703847 [Hyaloscypha hepaticicola]
MAWKEAAVLTLRREECASSSEWKEDRRNELKVFSEVTVAQKVQNESRREWRLANAAYDGDMCKVMTSCGGKRLVVVLGPSRCCGSGLAPILKPPIFLPHVMITLTSAESDFTGFLATFLEETLKDHTEPKYPVWVIRSSSISAIVLHASA